MTRRLLSLVFARLRHRQLPLSLSVVLALSGATGVAAALAYACYSLLGSPTIEPEQQIPLSTMLDVVKIVADTPATTYGGARGSPSGYLTACG